MKDDDTKPAPDAPPPVPGTRKLPYERPRVISDEVFETLALSCAQSPFGCAPGGNRS